MAPRIVPRGTFFIGTDSRGDIRDVDRSCDGACHHKAEHRYQQNVSRETFLGVAPRNDSRETFLIAGFAKGETSDNEG